MSGRYHRNVRTPPWVGSRPLYNGYRPKNQVSQGSVGKGRSGRDKEVVPEIGHSFQEVVLKSLIWPLLPGPKVESQGGVHVLSFSTEDVLARSSRLRARLVDNPSPHALRQWSSKVQKVEGGNCK